VSENNGAKRIDNGRVGPRVNTLENICVNYEGHAEEVMARLPNVSSRGMFINIGQHFPVGAVLNLKFRLAISGADIETRCEVRYCQPGVGMGVEFIGISAEAVRNIEREIEMCMVQRQKPAGSRRKKRPAKKRVQVRV
jgi:hypothetical protein